MLKRAISLFILIAALSGIMCACTPDSVPEDADKTEEPAPVPKMTLIDDGKTDYRIITAADASAQTLIAAEELQKYIEQMSGVKLGICTDETTPQEAEIILGPTNRGDFGADYSRLGKDGYKITTQGRTISVAGGQRGIIYGVYGLLQKYLGVGFYADDCEVVPSVSTLEIQEEIDDESLMAIPSGNYVFDIVDDDLSRMKLGFSPTSEEYGADPFTCVGMYGLHTINYLLAGTDNPESDPTYEIGKLHTYNQQPCVSSEENYQKILETALKWIAAKEDADYIGISHNDGPGGWCDCDECKKLNKEYGPSETDPTGSWWYFMNRIANDIQEKYPDIKIVTLAYEDTVTYPSNLELPDNIIVYLGTSQRQCMNHALNECEKNTEAGVVKALEDWTNSGLTIYLYEYFGCGSEFNNFYPNLYAMRNDFKLFSDSGVSKIDIFGTDKRAADFVDLRYYLSGKLLWNPDITEEEYDQLISEFCRAYYGEGGDKIKEYIDYTMQTFCTDRHLYINYGYVVAVQYPVKLKSEAYYPEVTDEMLNDPDYDWASLFKLEYLVDTSYIDHAYELIQQADDMTEDQTIKNRIAKVRIQVEYYETCVASSFSGHISKWFQKLTGRIQQGAVSEFQEKLGQKLWDDMVKYGCTRINEKYDPSPDDQPKLYEAPVSWFAEAAY